MRIVKRGCLWPKAAGGYVRISEEILQKYPEYYFLLEEPISVENFSIGHQGMQVFPSGALDENGQPIYDVYDWIGEGSYPNVMDWYWEVIHYGLHQLVATERSRMLPFNLIGPQSMYYPVHPRAGIVDPTPFYQDLRVKCELHPDTNGLMATCKNLHAENILEGKEVRPEIDPRLVERTMPSFAYNGFKPPEGEHKYYPAIFARFPIGLWAKFLVYTHPDGLHEQTLKNLDQLNQQLFEIEIVDLENEGEGVAI